MSFPLKIKDNSLKVFTESKTKNHTFYEPVQIFMLKFKLTCKSTLSDQHQGSEAIMAPQNPFPSKW